MTGRLPLPFFLTSSFCRCSCIVADARFARRLRLPCAAFSTLTLVLPVPPSKPPGLCGFLLQACVLHYPAFCSLHFPTLNSDFCPKTLWATRHPLLPVAPRLDAFASLRSSAYRSPSVCRPTPKSGPSLFSRRYFRWVCASGASPKPGPTLHPGTTGVLCSALRTLGTLGWELNRMIHIPPIRQTCSFLAGRFSFTPHSFSTTLIIPPYSLKTVLLRPIPSPPHFVNQGTSLCGRSQPQGTYSSWIMSALLH